MFTGIIEEIGTIKNSRRGSKSIVLTIEGKKIFSDLQIGDSVAVNGICLTATTITGHTFTADVMPESLRITSLTDWKTGSAVNLERAMAANGRFGGHMVAGHVDGTGRIKKMVTADNSVVITIETSPDVLEYIIYKGSIAIDGASLTVCEVTPTTFSVSIIPHTLQETILGQAKIGTKVNLETDIAGRYIRHFMQIGTTSNVSTADPCQAPTMKDANRKRTGLSKETLLENGFL